ncbi:AAA family ATPase [Serinicoccus marinus]|uniref:AAA family ATPase n=1 Tax=Serinicoccus marinus TaxID=247333 RepID=UPI0003B742F3|nr:chromosome partitioning protein [Serinicoccus marinus]
MSRPLVTAVAPRWESQVATLLDGSGQAHLVRRCADLAELLGVCRAGLAQVALVSWDVRGLDREMVHALVDAGAQVVGLHPQGDDEAARVLLRWGAHAALAMDGSTSDLDASLAGLDDGGAADRVDGLAPGQGVEESSLEVSRAAQQHAADARAGGRPTGGRLGRWRGRSRAGSTPVTEADEHDLDETAATSPDEPDALHDDEREGEVVVVWGPHGSTGRTTVAVNLAAELADPVRPVVLVDADTYGATVAQALAVLDESPGVAAATRAADQGSLDETALLRLAPQVRPGLRLLTGLPRADRWTELREAALSEVLQQARSVARWVVVDVAPTVEQDEELSFDTGAPRRNGAALCALQEADRVVVVGTGDPVGLQRLVRALDQLPTLTTARHQVVVTRVRSGPVGPEPGRRITETLRRFARTDEVRLVPEDRETLDAALLHGHTLAETRPGSPARTSIQQLARDLDGAGSAPPRRSRWAGLLGVGR